MQKDNIESVWYELLMIVRDRKKSAQDEYHFACDLWAHYINEIPEEIWEKIAHNFE